MKPDKEGWYWVRQNYLRRDTNEMVRGDAEVVWIVEGRLTRSKKMGLIACFAKHGGWQSPLDKLPDTIEWYPKIKPPL